MRRFWTGPGLAALLVAAPLAVRAADKDVKAAEKALREALKGQKIGEIDQAIQGLRVVGGEDAAEVLIDYAKKIPGGAEQLYWRLVNGAASMRDAAGLEAVGEEIVKGGALGRDLLYALQNNRSEAVPDSALKPVLLKGDLDLQLVASDQLGAIRRVVSVDVLLEGLKKHERKNEELKERIIRSLRSITGADMETYENWSKWWEVARAQGLEKREGSGRSTGTVVDHVDDGRWDEITALEKLEKGQIWVMTTECEKDARGCNFDEIGNLLDQMKVPYTPVTKQQFEKGEKKLDGVIAILLTCTQINEHCVCRACVPSGGPTTNRMTTCTGCDKHDLVKHKLSGEAVGKLKDWVERGGYLFTEDWGVADLLAPAWPKIVQQGKMLRKRSARVSPARGTTSHPLLRGVFVDPEVAKKSGEEGSTVSREDLEADIGSIERFWTIDDESPVIDIQTAHKVTVLMRSQDLLADGGPNGDAVAITFLPAGPATEKNSLAGRPERLRGGRVLHVLSHFAKQKSDQDAFALQNLLLNFLLEANRRAPKG